jgi:hypothetical protein
MFHPSGGLLYHLRAWRWADTLWNPFHREVRGWLTYWRPHARHLVLVGPSAGYALSRPFLERFPQLTALEPDALARHRLRRRFRSVHIGFGDSAPLAQLGGFAWLARQYPDAAFLFCNLLGQTLVGQPADQDRQVWLGQLESDLAGREWASWQDLASTSRPPDRHEPLALDQMEGLDSVLARYWQGGELSIHDHECDGLCPTLPRRYALWQLRPGRWHLVEWLASQPRTLELAAN